MVPEGNTPQVVSLRMRCLPSSRMLGAMSDGPLSPSIAGSRALQVLLARLESFPSDSLAGGSAEDGNIQQTVESLTEELTALQAIYGDDAISVLPLNGRYRGASTADEECALARWSPGAELRLLVNLPLDLDNVDPVKISVALPRSYPQCRDPPRVQLLNRYVGDFAVDHVLFGDVVRCFAKVNNGSGGSVARGRGSGSTDPWDELEEDDTEESESEGKGRRRRPKATHQSSGSSSLSQGGHVTWTQGEPVIFEVLEWCKEQISAWHGAKMNSKGTCESMNQPARTSDEKDNTGSVDDSLTGHLAAFSLHEGTDPTSPLWTDLPTLIPGQPITDRKSTFLGQCARITHPGQVPPLIVRYRQDRKIAKAAHPAIVAWVCKTDDGVTHRDCDDDGETAAGGRLAHLLDLLHVENALVIVTRWFGGVHLGADRFKHINQAARSALEEAGVIETASSRSILGGSKATRGAKTS